MSDLMVSPSAALSLVVAWRSGKTVHSRHVAVAGTVAKTLREYVMENAEKLKEEGGRDYTPDDDQGDAPFLRVPGDELIDHKVIEALRRGPSQPTAERDEMKKLQMYAVLVGDKVEEQSLFVRKGTPIKLGDKSLVAFLRESLDKVTEPIFAFDRFFDVIIAPDGAVTVLNQKGFNALFKDTEVVLAKTSEWVEELSGVLPIEAGSKVYLAEQLRKNSILRNKIQAILRKPHLMKLTPDALVEKMKNHDLEPDLLLDDGELVFNAQTKTDLLLLLNEDLFKGDFSGDSYAASKKAARTA
ncbi:Kiwa anti-phage protein KwaB-like domain-containing protein [Micromonospora sp. NPDC049101]|uniref:Kiwa anti-phage protein KwaB-like domain-containing protein n=1 Tax=Micromonospora sp. NPDC049101 TaxID=3155032 RepID=UPI0033E7A0EF